MMHEEEHDDSQPLINPNPQEQQVVAPSGSHFPAKPYTDLPPPYTPSPTTPTFSGSNVTISSDAVNPVITCRVCHALLSAEGKWHLHVIKCDNCGEATPIKLPPPLKKYVRCPCNCLLICSVRAHKVVCPRQNCKRVISLLPVPGNSNNLNINTQQEQSALNVRIVCGYCNFSFAPLRSLSQLQLCPHCNRRSFSSSLYKNRKLRLLGTMLSVVVVLIIIAIVLLIIEGPMLVTVAISVSFGFFGFFLFCMFFRFYFLKESQMERILSPQYT